MDGWLREGIVERSFTLARPLVMEVLDQASNIKIDIKNALMRQLISQ